MAKRGRYLRFFLVTILGIGQSDVGFFMLVSPQLRPPEPCRVRAPLRGRPREKNGHAEPKDDALVHTIGLS